MLQELKNSSGTSRKESNDYSVLVLKSNLYSKTIIKTEESQDLTNKIAENIENNLDHN